MYIHTCMYVYVYMYMYMYVSMVFIHVQHRKHSRKGCRHRNDLGKLPGLLGGVHEGTTHLQFAALLSRLKLDGPPAQKEQQTLRTLE